MSEKWIWLPDWAGDLSIWEDDLIEINSSASHSFVSYEVMSMNLEDLYKISGMSRADTIVAWGMGAFVLLLNAKNKPKNQKWVLLSPFADFCDESGVWNEQNLIFMARQMHITIEPALKSFAEQFEDEFGEWQEDWFKCASKMDVNALAKGILFLASNKLIQSVENSENMQVIYGRMDKSIPKEQTLKLKEFLPKATFKERPKSGHWPLTLLF